MHRPEKIGGNKEKPLLLVAPLDWGLGHCFRIIPIVRHLQDRGCDVIVGCNSIQKRLLESEVSGLHFVHLGGYGVHYGKTRIGTLLKLLLQLPNILIAVNAEQMWFLRFLRQNRLSAVISDNRYGLYSSRIPSVFITHQLQVSSGLGRLADHIASRLVQRRLSKFNRCWVPDNATSPTLAGELSHPKHLLTVAVQYLGPVSRFERCTASSTGGGILFLLSGPEPQRTIFEQKIVDDLAGGDHHEAVIVRGTDSAPAIIAPGHVKVVDFATSADLRQLICAADIVVCRPGYTTVMDLVYLQKKMLLVPTPGQGEQEYLARHLAAGRIAPWLSQRAFTVASALASVHAFSYKLPELDTGQYKKIIDEFIGGLSDGLR